MRKLLDSPTSSEPFYLFITQVFILELIDASSEMSSYQINDQANMTFRGTWFLLSRSWVHYYQSGAAQTAL
jgi:hypothetical protein